MLCLDECFGGAYETSPGKLTKVAGLDRIWLVARDPPEPPRWQDPLAFEFELECVELTRTHPAIMPRAAQNTGSESLAANRANVGWRARFQGPFDDADSLIHELADGGREVVWQHVGDPDEPAASVAVGEDLG